MGGQLNNQAHATLPIFCVKGEVSSMKVDCPPLVFQARARQTLSQLQRAVHRYSRHRLPSDREPRLCTLADEGVTEVDVAASQSLVLCEWVASLPEYTLVFFAK